MCVCFFPFTCTTTTVEALGNHTVQPVFKVFLSDILGWNLLLLRCRALFFGSIQVWKGWQGKRKRLLNIWLCLVPIYIPEYTGPVANVLFREWLRRLSSRKRSCPQECSQKSLHSTVWDGIRAPVPMGGVGGSNEKGKRWESAAAGKEGQLWSRC